MMNLIKQYGFGGFLKVLYSKIVTVLLFPGAQLIRMPIDIRNKRNMDFGKRLTCGQYCRFEAYPAPGRENDKLLIIGNDVQFNDSVHIVAVDKVVIGNNVLVASKIFISDSNHGDYKGMDQSHPDVPPIERKLSSAPVIIQDNVWIGEFVTILPGVVIGKGSVIGSMSVVSKDIPPYSTAVGSPARVVKTFNFDTKRWEKI